MAIYFILGGRCKNVGEQPKLWLDKAMSWIKTTAEDLCENIRVSQTSDGNARMVLSLHPCTEDIDIIVRKPNKVEVAARTSMGGMGYQSYLCDLFEKMGEEFDISWVKTTQDAAFFYKKDLAVLEEEFFHWVQSLTTNMLQVQMQHGSVNSMISMPMRQHFHEDGPIVTALGTRDLSWVRRVVSDPRRGTDIFPWWSMQFDDRFYFNRALGRMWKDVCWREPMEPEEIRAFGRIHVDLCRAYAKNPSLPFPWREWQEILDHLKTANLPIPKEGDIDLDPIIRENAAKVPSKQPLIGYRRKMYTCELMNSWRIDVPGSLHEAWQEDGERWAAWDQTRLMIFSCQNLSLPGGVRVSPETLGKHIHLPIGKRFEIQEHYNRGVGALGTYWADQDQRLPWKNYRGPLQHLCARSISETSVGSLEILYKDPNLGEWALETWRSLHRAERRTSIVKS